MRFKQPFEYLRRRLIRQPVDFVVLLGQQAQESSLMVAVPSDFLWKQETLRTRFVCLLRRQWMPESERVESAAAAVFREESFGYEEDYGDDLFALMDEHHRRQWDFTSLNELDRDKAKALQTFSAATRLRLGHLTTQPPLNLMLADRCLEICQLVYPMVTKIPVISLRYYVDLHVQFAFAEIRRSGHAKSDDIIAYLYEILFLQQKIAVSLSEYLRLASFTVEEKKESVLINAEVDTIRAADLVFSYLKASVEKTVSLIGMTHGITNLDAKKQHKARIDALQKGLPNEVKSTFYCEFALEFVSSENLDELNKYRSGLLHKKGIADLQPHNYVGIEPSGLPFKKIFGVLHEQHAKNSAVLLCALAMLMDELMRLEYKVDFNSQDNAPTSTDR